MYLNLKSFNKSERLFEGKTYYKTGGTFDRYHPKWNDWFLNAPKEMTSHGKKMTLICYKP